jgi:hypothetical protein
MQASNWRRALLAAVGVLIFTVGLVAPAQAAPPDWLDIPAGSPLDKCVSAATSAKHQQWTCFGGELTIEKDAKGNDVNRTERIAPELPTQAQGSPQASAGTAAFSTASYSSGSRATMLTIGSARVVPMAGGDYDDTWCENGSICTTTSSAYASKTKGNAAYGNQNGAIGAYDAILYTNLNGRQGQWSVKLIWDAGPSLKFWSPAVACLQKDFWQGAINCGYHYTSVDPTISSAVFRYTSNTLYGNKLVNAAEYYGQFRTAFTPSGYPQYIAAPLHGKVFNCPSGTGNCTFP